MIDLLIISLLTASGLLFAIGRASIKRARRNAWLQGERARIIGYDGNKPIVEFRKPRSTKRYEHSSQAGGINRRKFFSR